MSATLTSHVLRRPVDPHTPTAAFQGHHPTLFFSIYLAFPMQCPET